MNTIKVRDIEIGAGAPKIIVPIVGVTKEDILNEAKTFDSIPVDVVEWRVDWFEHVFEFDKVEDVLKELRTVLGNIPLLLTFRTKMTVRAFISPQPVSSSPSWTMRESCSSAWRRAAPSFCRRTSRPRKCFGRTRCSPL